jgi:uncharacterized protein YjdB
MRQHKSSESFSIFAKGIVSLMSWVLFVGFLSGCGGGNGGTAVPNQPQSIQVTITPQVNALSAGATQQFSAVVTGTSNQSVSWSINNIGGGNGTLGTISGSGLYTAPTTIPNPASIIITATSAIDTSKSASISVALKFKIAVSPENVNIQVFHSQQFVATVLGVSNTAVQWSINGIAGGNAQIGTIDSAGFYTAPIALPASPSIQVQAISAADNSQSASTQALLVTDTVPPQIAAVSPSNLDTNVTLQPNIQIKFNEGMDPSSLISSFSLLQGTTSIPVKVGYDPNQNLVTLTPEGLLTPGTQYTVAVGGTAQDLSGNPIAAPFSSSFTTIASTAVSSAITAPPGIDPTTMNVVSFQGQTSIPAADGTFSASVRPQGTTALAAMVPGESFGLFAIAIGDPASAAAQTQTKALMVGTATVYSSQWQITRSSALAQVSQPMVLDFQTTAESLLFLSPALFHSDTDKAKQIMTAIAAEPKTTQVATALQAAWNTPFPLRDPDFVTAYSDALRSILSTLSQSGPRAAATAKGNFPAANIIPSLAAAGSSAVVYHSFDVCCINLGSASLQSNNYILPININGPSPQQPLGSASGWLVRVVKLPASFDPTTIIPGTDANGNVDSPLVTAGENIDPVVNTFWVPGKSLFQYTDILGQLNTFLSGFLNSLAGFAAPDATNLSLIQPVPGTSTSYLLRAYSGGDNDPNELNLITTLPDGRSLWINARLANYTAVIFDEIDALGVVPSGIVNCLVKDAVQDEVTSVLIDPSSASFIGGGSAWSGFINTNVAILSDFKNNFSSCAVSSSLDSFFKMLADITELGSGIGDILQGISIISSAGHAIQIVTEMEATDSPVDTAYITLTNTAVPRTAGITVSPQNPTIIAGGQQPFSFVARDALGNIISNANVTWNSSDQSIATVNNSGVAIGIAAGQARITVSDPATGASSNTFLTITTPTLDHLGIAPALSTLHVGQTAQFNVFGISSTGNPFPLGTAVWSSSPAGIVSVSQTGLVTALQAGSTFINADSGGKSVAATIQVIAATPGQIVVTPANATINVGSTFPLAAKAIDASGNPISGVSFAWGLNSPAGVATVDPNGTVHAVAAGQATITATAGGISGLASITVLVAGSQLSLSGSSVCIGGIPQVQLQWNNINAASYDLYRDNVLLVPNILANTLTDTTNLIAGTAFDYFLKAHMGTGGTVNSNIATVSIPATCPGAAGKINVFPAVFNPVFTVGDAPATLGFQITNLGAGSLTGTIAANPVGGAWLTVNGHTSFNWVAPESINVTADPTGLAPGTYTGTMAVSSAGAINSPISIPVQMTIYPVLQITTGSIPTVFSDKPFSLTLNVTGGSGTGYVWSLRSGTLPPGLTLSSAGVISGTAGSISGTSSSNVNIGVQDSVGHFKFKTFAITFQESLFIQPISPSNFTFSVGNPYTTAANSITMQAVGGTPPYTWSATGMPPGLTMNASGLITGTPAQSGTFPASVTVSDTKGLSATAIVPLTVILTTLKVTDSTGQSPPNLPAGTVGIAYTQFLNAVGGSQSGYTWNVLGTLPPGLVPTNAPGCPATCGLHISGTPTQAGTFAFTAVVTDSLKNTAQQDVTIAINTGTPPQITTATLPLATIGQPYNSMLIATGGTPPYIWTIIGASPDPGLQLSASGVINGTTGVPNDCPTGPALWLSAGPSTFFQVQVKDSAGQSSIRQLCLPSYFPTPQITGLSPASVIVDGQAHVITVNGTNFRNNAFLDLASGSVPTTFVGSTALSFSLTPALGGAFSPGSGVIGEGIFPVQVLEPYAMTSTQINFTVFDPPPTVVSVTAVLNNSTNPCTTNLNCQLVIQGGGLVFTTGYQIVETNTTLIRAANPSTPIPWNTVTTSTFSVSVPGTYTLIVTNPNQPPGGGSASVSAHFTVAQ